MNANETPARLGCRWPAEWEPHAATWLAWPHNRGTWPGRFDLIPEQFARFVGTLARFEPVHLLAGGEAVMRQAQAHVGDLPNVTLQDICTNDAWVRDYGPTFLVEPSRRETVVVNWQFNCWGGKYSPWDLDNRVSEHIAAQLQVRSFVPEMVLEGGAIDGNGRGLVLTTESCLLDHRRNASLGRPDMERLLRDYCCAARVLWLRGEAIAGDDTDGHIDQLVRFVSPDQVVVAVEDNPQDENYAPLQANLLQLGAISHQFDRPLDLIPLPMPQPIIIGGRRVPASYCNFYIANGCVLLPQFEDPADKVAQEILQPLFPDRQIIGLPARELIWGLGAFHCLTQQQPAPQPSEPRIN